ncbi:MAG: site-specific integrase [Firmicutes bacterium]|nr:site-specific integrase [Bacillota bacterium]
MELVHPIRDKKSLEAMKRVLRGGHEGLRNHCLFVLGVNSGLRVSDLLALHVDDVLGERGKVQDRIVLREQKTGKSKDFPLGNTAKKAIAEYMATRPQCGRDEPLFLSRHGKALSRIQAWSILSEAAKAVGIKESVGTHTLRKTFGYWAYVSGVDVTRIQKLLNHSAPSITLAYIGITRDELDNVYLTLDL